MCLTSKKSCARLAFSLVELLIVMIVIAVLVAVAVPSFIRFCGNSAQAVMASDPRQHATVFTTQPADFKGFLPYFTDPINSPTTLTDPIGGHVWPQVFYFSASTLWPLVLNSLVLRRQREPPIISLTRPAHGPPKWRKLEVQLLLSVRLHR